MKVVLGTNVILSALLVAHGHPAQILSEVIRGNLETCYDNRIILEYEAVLTRPRFPFARNDIVLLLDTIVSIGIAVHAKPSNADFPDLADKKFYEVASSAGAYLVTGNTKHFPVDEHVVTPAALLALL